MIQELSFTALSQTSVVGHVAVRRRPQPRNVSEWLHSLAQRVTQPTAASEQQAHIYYVPQLATLTTDLFDAVTLFDEPELAVERNRSDVVWEDLEAQLVEALAS
jgi:hypothetical protein